MLAEWVFVLLLHLPTFGGPIRVKFEVTTEDGCRRLQRVVTREMDGLRLRYSLVECSLDTEEKIIPQNHGA